ncbi:DUF2065 domain-containing protein [Jiella endophytica]|uniref:DUF2065 domain-containing protein n=1 Tax=Jiella endophytica TaxID=2558362 RepID=A0A4Y8RJP6_9HYPH|nr:DUF2065 family protein [Jiella endophytica]TFF22962.1 DUF2065 domain-containing protein [Jiella endophytica]
MMDFFDALGLLLVIEGVVYCLFPLLAKRLAQAAIAAPPDRLRFGGLAAVCLGLAIVWLARM